MPTFSPAGYIQERFGAVCSPFVAILLLLEAHRGFTAFAAVLADLCAAVLQSIEDKERGVSLQPGVLPSWAVPAIEGIPEAVQAASAAAQQAAKDAVQSVVAAGSSTLLASEKVWRTGHVTV